MDLQTQMYLTLGLISIVIFFVVLLKVAGKDIIFAFYRKMKPRNTDVFIVNSNKQVDHFYEKTDKNGVFKIEDNIYITNPDKLQGLSDTMIKQVQMNISLGVKKIKSSINKLNIKKAVLLKKLRALPETAESLPTIEIINSEVAGIDNKVELLKSKLTQRENGYYMQRRGCYFYIKGDPVPKDFFEMYTEIDSIQLENVIIRAQSEGANNVEELQKTITVIKKLMIVSIGLGAIACFFAFRSTEGVKEIAQNMGVELSV